MIALLKYLHVTAVAVSLALFYLRGIWIFRNSPVMHQRWVKIVPHVVDTVLLASAITLAWLLGLSPLKTPWLMAKIIGLLVYIALGFIALDFSRRSYTRLGFWLAAQLVFFYIVAVAISKKVLPWAGM